MTKVVNEKPAGIVRSHQDTLAELRKDYGKLKKGFTKQLTEAKDFGVRLLKLKPQFPRTWMAALKEIGISYSNASRFIRLAENWDKVKSDKNIDTIDKAIKMLQIRKEDKLTGPVNSKVANVSENAQKQQENKGKKQEEHSQSNPKEKLPPAAPGVETIAEWLRDIYKLMGEGRDGAIMPYCRQRLEELKQPLILLNKPKA